MYLHTTRSPGVVRVVSLAVDAHPRRVEPQYRPLQGRSRVDEARPRSRDALLLFLNGKRYPTSVGPRLLFSAWLVGRATVASHGPQMGNGGRTTVASHGPQIGNGGRATVASHGPQMAKCGCATGRPAGRRKDGKKKSPKRCFLCVQAGRVPECYSCKGRGGRAKCPHLG